MVTRCNSGNLYLLKTCYIHTSTCNFITLSIITCNSHPRFPTTVLGSGRQMFDTIQLHSNCISCKNIALPTFPVSQNIKNLIKSDMTKFSQLKCFKYYCKRVRSSVVQHWKLCVYNFIEVVCQWVQLSLSLTRSLIQIYMGDKKGRLSQMQAAQEIISKGWSITNLRDEIYMQLCKQTTENRKEYVLTVGPIEWAQSKP